MAIFSDKKKSPWGGAQYLHREIPGVTAPTPDGYVRFIKVGTGRGYAQKVYGRPDAKVSWDLFEEGIVPAWSMGKVYDTLWDRWEKQVTDFRLSPAKAEAIVDEYDKVFCSIPLPVICRDESHRFDRKDVVLVPDEAVPVHNTVVYNGQPTENWYRSSSLFGVGWTEYAADAGPPPITGAREMGFKPISNTCDCHPSIVRIGRFGRWERDVLIHHAWEEVGDAL